MLPSCSIHWPSMALLSAMACLRLLIVAAMAVVVRSLELYQSPPPPPMKPGWGSLPQVDPPQVVGLKAGRIEASPLLCDVHVILSGWCGKHLSMKTSILVAAAPPCMPFCGSNKVSSHSFQLSARRCTAVSYEPLCAVQNDIQKALALSPEAALAAKAVFGLEPKVCI